ncbi:hypothetical protein PRIC2_001785 [Phytophthora ramorum]
MSSRLLLAALLLQEAAAFTYQQSGYWETSDCSDAPFYMDIFPEANCGQLNITYNCSPYTFNSTEYYRTVICVEDTQVWTKSYYKSTDYVLLEQFDTSSSDCDEYFEGRVFLANESCIKMINSTSYQSAIASVGSDDAQTLKLYTDNKCSTTAAKSFSIESSVVADHSCYDSEYKFFSESEYTSGSGSYSGSESESASQSNGASASASESASASGGVSGSSASSAGSSSGSTVEGVVGDSSGSGLGTGIIVVIVVVAVVVALGIGWLIFWFGRRSAGRKQRENGAPLSDKEDGFVNMNAVPSRTVDDMFTSESDGDGSPLWRDEAILGARVPREKVAVQQLISRGPPTPSTAKAQAKKTYKRPQCKHEGCTNQVKSKGLCKSHGGGIRCKAEGCDKPAHKGGRCYTHGGKACSVEGCDKSAQRKGLCYAHGGKPAEAKRCSVSGCLMVARTRNLCRAHGGGAQCEVNGCEKVAEPGGRCGAHGGGKRCEAEGCTKRRLTKGLCWDHGGGARCTLEWCNNRADRSGLCIVHKEEERRMKAGTVPTTEDFLAVDSDDDEYGSSWTTGNETADAASSATTLIPGKEVMEESSDGVAPAGKDAANVSSSGSAKRTE